jgi:hydroxymethylglutaryl-CoA lyase
MVGPLPGTDQTLQLTECPRDAMQGLADFIPTAQKVAYLNALLRVGFDTLDFGSFVSPKAIPQLRDTAEVLAQLDLAGSRTKLLAIVAGLGGAKLALAHPEIFYLGFPLSVSETFQQRNTQRSIAQAVDTVREIHQLCQPVGKTLIVYLSMAFGNPYGDPYSPEIVGALAQRVAELGIGHISLADTIGVSQPANIRRLFGWLVPALPGLCIGAHFHSPPASAVDKVAAAWEVGCRRFDAAMLGFGGCPMAEDSLTGNIATEAMVQYFHHHQIATGLDMQAFAAARQLAASVFHSHGN